MVGSSRVVAQARYCPSITPGHYGLTWEPLDLIAEDGVAIAGWFLPAPHPEGVLLLLHGFGTSKADLLDVAEAFHAPLAYHLILIDFRGHGASAGKSFSFGRWEVLDVQAVLSFLEKDPSLRGLPVGAYGVSMGGAIALLAAARFPRIKAVVSDSAYADLPKAIARIQWLSYHIPRFPLGQMVVWGTACRLGVRLRALSPVSVVERIAPRGVFVIHGMQDRTIPPEEGEALYRAAKDPKRLWLVPQAEHIASFYLGRSLYVERVMEFFRDAFRRAP